MGKYIFCAKCDKALTITYCNKSDCTKDTEIVFCEACLKNVYDLPELDKYDEIFVCDDGVWMKAYFLFIIIALDAYISASFEKDSEPYIFDEFALENPLIHPETPIYKAEDYI